MSDFAAEADAASQEAVVPAAAKKQEARNRQHEAVPQAWHPEPGEEGGAHVGLEARARSRSAGTAWSQPSL